LGNPAPEDEVVDLDPGVGVEAQRAVSLRVFLLERLADPKHVFLVPHAQHWRGGSLDVQLPAELHVELEGVLDVRLAVPLTREVPASHVLKPAHRLVERGVVGQVLVGRRVEQV
jgi:hypothetical protein